MAERPLAQRGLKNPLDRADVSASRPARKEPCKFAVERGEPGGSKLPGRELEEVREKDPNGRIVVHRRNIDSLRKLQRSGGISDAMYDAGRAFERDFQFAGLDPIRARPMMLPARGGGGSEVTEGQLDAKRRVHRALEALGGIGSPAGSCVWHVVGLQHSVREWAMRQGWSGRPVRQEQATGILIAALGMLAVHIGYGGAMRAS